MANQNPITGIPHIDSDIRSLFKFAEDKSNLTTAKKTIEDDSKTLEQLQDTIPAPILKASLSLLDKDTTDAILDTIKEDQRRQAFQQAIDLVSQHFKGLDRHPAIVSELRREIKKREPTRDDGENTIVGIGWEDIWREEEGKLIPAMRLRLRGKSQKLLLASTVDWEDLTFIIRALCGALKGHMKTSKPVHKAELLQVENSEKIGKQLVGISENLQQICELAEGFGIKAPSEAEGKTADD